ncbi:MAG: UDP-N-acetylglucosamine 1-carboxyvinyltransferase, partial [Candidatus Kapaibacterium sp.]
MDKFIVHGNTRLQGTVKISGAKNASLALMPACLLTSGTLTLTNTPNNRDLGTMSRLLGSMGVGMHLEGDVLSLDSSNITSHEAPYEHVKQMRAS